MMMIMLIMTVLNLARARLQRLSLKNAQLSLRKNRATALFNKLEKSTFF
jgi:hypothetical protein